MKKLRRSIFFPIMRILGLCFIGMVVAVVVALSQVNLETLRGNLLTLLRDATDMPIEIDGAVSWKLSLRPHVELNKVRIANQSWAKNKDAFSAEKIDVRLNLLSLFRNRPTIQNVKVYDAKLNIEKNVDGKYSIQRISRVTEEQTQLVNATEPEKYPFKDVGLGGFEIKNLKADVFGKKYSLSGFHIRLMPMAEGREYSGWIKVDKNVSPFIINFSEYNTQRKVYPVRVAVSTGGQALIANVALEGKSKAPIDFVIKGDLVSPENVGRFFGVDLSWLPSLNLEVVGGFDWKKITLRRSKVIVNGTKFVFSGDYDWSKPGAFFNANVSAARVDLAELIPGLYGVERGKINRKLNVFKNIPLFGEYMLNRNINLNVNIDDFIVYKDLNLEKLVLGVNVKDNHLHANIGTGIADGNVVVGIEADVDGTGRLWGHVGAKGKDIYVGEILKEIHRSEFISELPVDFGFYVQANGKNLSEVMQTITGPVQVYSVAPGYAHSSLVSYIYGTDFLTTLRHGIQDLFSSEKKYNQIKISCVAVNAKLRDGLIETQNGVAVETNAINLRLAGSLDLGKEEMHLSLTTVPVRGLKLSLTGNVVNSIELTGSLAEPDIQISGAAVAGKVASATGIGLLLAPFTGGIGLVAGTGVGLIAGDLLENWLADSKPCETAMERGAPLFRDDPEWMELPMAELLDAVLID